MFDEISSMCNNFNDFILIELKAAESCLTNNCLEKERKGKINISISGSGVYKACSYHVNCFVLAFPTGLLNHLTDVIRIIWILKKKMLFCQYYPKPNLIMFSTIILYLQTYCQ